ncbi:MULTISPECIES: SidA/IucD/PvdA family monooxygenase [Pseudomonas]|jgi:L-ornithine N5-oxygenase|uniref:lysine N(6)-hydroxylase/L-ornithine N(5)-oxygenase family protein n=1 Tax=Pseudomonas TaxID=286 RepID=UPI000CEE55C2|nr:MULTISPECIES: SidA/IucD/PvdA family monooxygenase [unclassified Pseudomonas]MCO7507111.1 SidA/IucD/PvdA family monooxygenase [Pseudomonas sp. VE 267-6A]MCO7532815.1 SidA/IucD/PvdA family monooxygenase [Pseudomonas sp. 2]MCQ0169864.1 ornithine monooxygenase [Pseudomonas sp. S12(2018)]MDD1958011.1 SidA/IucD/PvdA family monooxygenase [Pseudomonas sp. 8209]PPS61504.1 ornithine monooxygenase [Pseudomonas sp. BRM28]
MNQPSTSETIHDLIGVGFGPSNLALAIALEELAQTNGHALDALFIDKQSDYRWHGNTLATQSELQISFLKDLVSLRNPTSPYSFVNYLHQKKRLADFINLGTFYPCRLEYNDYLRWAAEHFATQAVYGEEILRVEPELLDGRIDHLRVISRSAQGHERLRRARSVVVGSGGTPKIPPVFAPFKDDPRVFHHSQYLNSLEQLPCTQGKPMRIAIIGSGQSAAEALIDLNDSYPSVKADMILRGSALKPADDSPFVNEVFTPDYTDLVFNQPQAERAKLISEYHNTNYSVVDIDLIERIYGMLYRQKVAHQYRHAVLCRRNIEAAVSTDKGIELTLRDLATGIQQTHVYDAVILATGYERRSHRELLAPLQQHLKDFEVDRDYRVLASPELNAAVYLQGFCEASHGLSDTLLSVLPVRAAEIGQSLYQSLGQRASNARASATLASA